MLKKSLFVLVALAMVATMAMVPVASGAEGLADSLFFEADFSDGSADDKTGNYTFEELQSADLVTETDSTLNRTVAVFSDGCLYYSGTEAFAGYDLTEGLTLEVYIYLEDQQTNMVFIESAGSSLHLQQYNDGKDAAVGFRCGDLNDAGVFDMRNAYTEEGTILPAGQWVHLIGTSDGLTNKFYIDGELAVTLDRTQTLLKTVNDNTNKEMVLGESYLGDMWGATAMQGKMAFARVYKAAVTDAEAAELYAAATGNEAPEPSNDPSTEPSTEPSVEPSDGPSESPSVNPSTSPSDGNGNGSSGSTTKPGNAQTFDLGIVSLAAVALSSAVAIKKRK